MAKSSGQAPSELGLVAAMEKRWCENGALNTSTSADSIYDFRYVGMAEYLVQQPKFRNVCGSGEATDGAV